MDFPARLLHTFHYIPYDVPQIIPHVCFAKTIDTFQTWWKFDFQYSQYTPAKPFGAAFLTSYHVYVLIVFAVAGATYFKYYAKTIK